MPGISPSGGALWFTIDHQKADMSLRTPIVVRRLTSYDNSFGQHVPVPVHQWMVSSGLLSIDP